ncbi:MAG TPA: ABC transporter permease subunit [Acidimicrobiales bacterium]|nr:ABC transporter permease subunit [Acidimicrobiales bacterium]
MTALVLAEARKLRRTRSLLALPLLAVAYPLVTLAAAAFAPEGERATLDAGLLLGALRGVADVARFAALMVGILAVAGEFRHGTIVPALLATPRRARLVAAKLVSQAGTGLVVALAASAVCLATAGPWLAGQGVDVDPLSGDVALVVLGATVGVVCYAAIGAALGWLVRNQTAAIAGALVWLLAVEEVIPIVLRRPGLRRWLPGGAATSLLRLGEPAVGAGRAWAALALLLAVTAALAAAAFVAVARADVD